MQASKWPSEWPLGKYRQKTPQGLLRSVALYTDALLIHSHPAQKRHSCQKIKGGQKAFLSRCWLACVSACLIIMTFFWMQDTQEE